GPRSGPRCGSSRGGARSRSRCGPRAAAPRPLPWLARASRPPSTSPPPRSRSRAPPAAPARTPAPAPGPPTPPPRPPRAQRPPPLAALGVVPVRQASDEVAGADRIGRCLDLLVLRAWAPEGDVLPDAPGEEEALLGHDPELASQAARAEVPKVVAVHQHPA